MTSTTVLRVERRAGARASARRRAVGRPVHVTRRSDGFWIVCVGDACHPVSMHDDMACATAAALRHAGAGGGGDVVVHDPIEGELRLWAPARPGR